jgi:hypothetical protein
MLERGSQPKRHLLAWGLNGFCLILAWTVGAAQAQDPLKLMVPMEPGRALKGSTNPTPYEVDSLSAAAAGILAKARALEGEYSQKQKAIDEESKEASPDRVHELEKHKESELDEYRRGQFCSGCGKTRSEILATGDQFPHPGQHVVLPTADQVDNKTREWDRKIETAKRQEQAAKARCIVLVKERNTITRNAETTLIEWKNAMLAADQKAAEAWERTLAEYKKAVRNTRLMIGTSEQRLERERAKGPKASPDVLVGLRTGIDAVRGNLGNLAKQAKTDFFARQQNLASFEKTLADGKGEFVRILGAVGARAMIVPDLPSLGGSLPGTPFSADLKADSIEMSAGLAMGEISGVLRLHAAMRASSDWLRNEMDVGVSLEAELPVIGAYGIGVANKTKYSASGVTSVMGPDVRSGNRETIRKGGSHQTPGPLDLMIPAASDSRTGAGTGRLDQGRGSNGVGDVSGSECARRKRDRDLCWQELERRCESARESCSRNCGPEGKSMASSTKYWTCRNKCTGPEPCSFMEPDPCPTNCGSRSSSAR